MQVLMWKSESNGVYLPDIDQEHKSLFEMTDEVCQALQAGCRVDEVEPKLRELVAHAIGHFAHEEKMMKAKRYPAYRWHKDQHTTVRNRLAGVDGFIHSGDREAIIAVLDYLSAWFQTHTAVSDRMMGAYLRNNRKHD